MAVVVGSAPESDELGRNGIDTVVAYCRRRKLVKGRADRLGGDCSDSNTWPPRTHSTCSHTISNRMRCSTTSRALRKSTKP